MWAILQTKEGRNMNELKEALSQLDKGELTEILQGCKLVDVALDIGAVVKMPRDTAIMTMLGVVSAAVSMLYRTEYQHGGKIPVGLYVACEQPPSTGKSGLVSMMQAPLFEALKGLREAHIPFTGFLTDTTPEAMESTLSNAGGLFMLASTEQTLINSLLGLSYKENSSHNNNSLILEGYSGDWHSSARITRKGYVGNVHGAITLISQNGTIDKILSSSNGTGISERFFLFTEPDMLGMRDHTETHKRSPELQNDYAKAIQKIIKQVIVNNGYDRERIAHSLDLVLTGDPAYDVDVQKQIDELVIPLRNFTDLDCLHASYSSWEYINGQKNEVEKLMGGGAAFESNLMRSYAGKLDQRVLKVASVLHVMEALFADKAVDSIIDHQYIVMAVKLARWSNKQVYQIATNKGFIGKPAEHDAILNYMSKKNRPLRETEIKQGCKGLAVFNVKRGGAGNAIAETLDAMVKDKILAVTSMMGSTGRSHNVYVIQ
ncbi:DUF3987 domain-containing protein [Shewanella algae]|uniref:DUF3987 domain-containing protein n=2 Tax=Shewanella algae TaxID=38313 RepID=UPI001C58BD3C|nr:DUF3987 domain-containing protein [Shewanella algae]